jgi:hypothetical protein
MIALLERNRRLTVVERRRDHGRALLQPGFVAWQATANETVVGGR